MRFGFRIGPLWISERVPPIPWPPKARTIFLLILMIILAWLITSLR